MSPVLRILHCFRAPVGGLFRHVRDLALEQSRRGNAVGIVCAEGGDTLTDQRLEALGAELEFGVHRVPLGRIPGIADVAAAIAVVRLARRIGADVVHGHGAKGGFVARAVGMQPGARPKVFYTPHGGSLHFARTTVQGRVILATERFLERFTDGLLFECRYAAQRYTDVVGAPRPAVRVVPNGVRPGEFELRRLDADATDLLFVGELRRLKGVDVLLQAIAQLGVGGRRVTATIVGDGPDAAEFREMAGDLAIADRVRFTGAMPMVDALELGQVLVVPSRAESFPYVVLEAAAAGVPIVASRVGGIAEIAEGTGTPLLPAGDVGALAEAIDRVMRDEQQTESAAAALRRRVGDRCTVAAMVDGIATFYGAVIHHTDVRSAPAAQQP